MLTSGVLHHFNVQQQEDGGFSTKHEPPLQGFTNPSMQIHVQNVPFVYNPDTISVGLGFSEAKKNVCNTLHQKFQCCVQLVVYPSLPFALHHIKKLTTVCYREILNICLSVTVLVLQFSSGISLHGKADQVTSPYIITIY